MSDNNSTPPSDDNASRKRPRRPLPEPDFYTTADIAALLRCSEKTARRRIRANLIPARREGGRWLILPRDYYEYARKLERQTQERRFDRLVKRALKNRPKGPRKRAKKPD